MSVAVPVIASWNGATRRIYLAQGVTAFHWIDDIYKEYRNWRRTVEAARQWAPLMMAAGNNPKGGGKYTPRYITLLEGCRVVPYDENILIVVTGEAITDNADVDPDPFDTSTRTQALKLYITPPASELVRAEAEIAAVNRMSFGGGVSFDEVYGVLGTGGLKGNTEFPVKLLADAITIAEANSFDTFMVIGNLSTLVSGDNIAGYHIIGQDEVSTLLTLPTLGGVSTIATKMDRLTLTGKCSGRLVMRDACLDGVTALCATGGDAYFYNCRLKNTIQLNAVANQTFHFVNCRGEGNTTLDINGCPAGVVFTNFQGKIKFENMTNALSVLDMDTPSGLIILDPSMTAGSMFLRGNGARVGNTGGTIVDSSGFNEGSIGQYGKVVYIDAAGQAGTEAPIGLFENPVSNMPDAIYILHDKFGNTLHFHSDMPIASGVDLTSLIVEAHSTFVHLLTLASGVITLNTVFKSARITGAFQGLATFESCMLVDATHVEGNLQHCTLDGSIAFEYNSMSMVHMNGCRSHTQAPTTLSVGAAMVNAIDTFGMFEIANKTGVAEFNMHCGFGAITIKASCTAGSIYLAGVGYITKEVGATSTVICNGRVIPADGVMYSMEEAATGALTTDQNTKLTELHGGMSRQLGLMMENHVEDDIVRNAAGLKTSSKFYLYDSKANALLHDKVTGLLPDTYSVSITYDTNNRTNLFKVVRN